MKSETVNYLCRLFYRSGCIESKNDCFDLNNARIKKNIYLYQLTVIFLADKSKLKLPQY